MTRRDTVMRRARAVRNGCATTRRDAMPPPEGATARGSMTSAYAAAQHTML
jgi:hypothetical protein